MPALVTVISLWQIRPLTHALCWMSGSVRTLQVSTCIFELLFNNPLKSAMLIHMLIECEKNVIEYHRYFNDTGSYLKITSKTHYTRPSFCFPQRRATTCLCTNTSSRRTWAQTCGRASSVWPRPSRVSE